MRNRLFPLLLALIIASLGFGTALAELNDQRYRCCTVQDLAAM